MLNAVEAKYYFELQTDDCVLIIMGDRKSQPQLLMLSKVLNEWGRVIILNDVNLFFGNPLEITKKVALWKRVWQTRLFSKSFFNVRRLNRISKQLGQVRYIFVGYARYIYMKHFINITRHQDVVLLDDGHATIQLAKERKLGPDQSDYIGHTKRLKLLAKTYLQGVQHKEKENVCFFTIYDVSTNKNDRIIRHNFEHIKTNISAIERTAEVYFLGSPLTRLGIITEDEYVKHLQRVKDYFKDRNLVYISHRRETPEHLDEIGRALGIKVIRLDYPVEYQLAIIGPRPEILASFISSALDSCGLIFSDYMKIVSFMLDLEPSPEREEIELIYESYKSSTNKNFVVESEY